MNCWFTKQRPHWLAIVLLGSLAACSGSRESPTPADLGIRKLSVPPQLLAKPERSARITTDPPSANLQITPDDEIFFTDPDNPESSLPELTEVLSSAPDRRADWEQSETIARRLALREGKPLLIWFTDSAKSPACRLLARELFEQPEFGAWAGEKLIRLKVDSNIVIDDESLSLDDKETLRIERQKHVKKLRNHYKVMGSPMLVLCGPDGKVLGRYRGYRQGQADFYWGLIKQGEAAVANTYAEWRRELENKGYREWHDRRGRVVFARLIRYTEGMLTLIEPDGFRSVARESTLSEADQAWIRQRKGSAPTNKH